MQRVARMKKELEMLEKDPPHGISCWPVEDKLDQLNAQVQGTKDTPYEGGIFGLEIGIPERYPFEPPKVKFTTPIYHPNIDTEGRICLDILKMPPKGAWKPSLNISTLLTSIQLLMNEPNPDDALMADIAAEFKQNKVLFDQKARQQTRKLMEDKDKGTDPEKDQGKDSEQAGQVQGNKDTTATETPQPEDDKMKKRSLLKRAAEPSEPSQTSSSSSSGSLAQKRRVE